MIAAEDEGVGRALQDGGHSPAVGLDAGGVRVVSVLDQFDHGHQARIVAFIPDLLFGSNVVGSLQAAGHEVALVATPAGAAGAELLIVDLTAEVPERLAAVADAELPGVPKLAFYSHVEADVRRRALEAGFDLVVPRSRMAREGAQLADSLLRVRRSVDPS